MTTALRMVPMAMAMGAIFFLSHQPGDSFSLPSLPGIDKLAHMFVYGVLAATVLFAFGGRGGKQKEMSAWRVMLFTVAFCFVYGLSDEFHQSFVPGRCPSGYDMIADCVGAAMTCAFWARWRERIAVLKYW